MWVKLWSGLWEGTSPTDTSIHLKSLQGFPGGSVVKNPPVVQVMQETQVQSLGREGPLEEEMATHSSIPACKIPWIEEPRGLQSVGVA